MIDRLACRCILIISVFGAMVVYAQDQNQVSLPLRCNSQMEERLGPVNHTQLSAFATRASANVNRSWAVEDRSRLGLILYQWRGTGGYMPTWGTQDMSQGPGALAWLIGDISGDGKAKIIQPWNSGGRNLGFIVYGWDGQRMGALWGTQSMGLASYQRPVAWFVGDVNGDGKSEVVYAWDNGNAKLFMNVFGWNGARLNQLNRKAITGQGTGAVAWLMGDITGDKKAEVVQLWNSKGHLGMIVYGWDGSGMTAIWGSSNMGQGSGAVAWLIGDINRDGKSEVVQLWNSKGHLGMIVYGWNGSAMTTLWGTGDVGQGAGATAWLIGDINGDGKAEVIQLWNSNSRLGMLVYGWNGSAMSTIWGSTNMGQGAGAMAWLIGNVNGDSKAEVIQLWNSDSRLGMLVYGWNGSAMSTIWGSTNMGQGAGAMAWLIGDIDGDGRADVLQPWKYTPPPPPQVSKTCSGQIASTGASVWTVLWVDPLSGCSGSSVQLANTPAEAEQCVGAFGVTPVHTLCEFILILRDRTSCWDSKVISDSSVNAMKCAAQTICSNCTIQDVTPQVSPLRLPGQCVGGYDWTAINNQCSH